MVLFPECHLSQKSFIHITAACLLIYLFSLETRSLYIDLGSLLVWFPFFIIVLIRLSNQRQLKRGKVQAYRLQFIIKGSQGRNSSRNVKQKSRRNSTCWPTHRPIFLACLYSPGPAAQGKMLPTVGWALWRQVRKQSTTDTLTGQCYLGCPSTETPSDNSRLC